jgi:hypothetical protein
MNSCTFIDNVYDRDGGECLRKLLDLTADRTEVDDDDDNNNSLVKPCLLIFHVHCVCCGVENVFSIHRRRIPVLTALFCWFTCLRIALRGQPIIGDKVCILGQTNIYLPIFYLQNTLLLLGPVSSLFSSKCPLYYYPFVLSPLYPVIIWYPVYVLTVLYTFYIPVYLSPCPLSSAVCLVKIFCKRSYSVLLTLFFVFFNLLFSVGYPPHLLAVLLKSC